MNNLEQNGTNIFLKAQNIVGGLAEKLAQEFAAPPIVEEVTAPPIVEEVTAPPIVEEVTAPPIVEADDPHTITMNWTIREKEPQTSTISQVEPTAPSLKLTVMQLRNQLWNLYINVIKPKLLARPELLKLVPSKFEKLLKPEIEKELVNFASVRGYTIPTDLLTSMSQKMINDAIKKISEEKGMKPITKVTLGVGLIALIALGTGLISRIWKKE